MHIKTLPFIMTHIVFNCTLTVAGEVSQKLRTLSDITEDIGSMLPPTGRLKTIFNSSSSIPHTIL